MFRTEDILKIEFLKNIKQHVQKSPEWLAQRKDKLTSSDGGTALGINPYEKPIDIVFKKNNCGKQFVGNIATKHGERFEFEAIQIYCKLMNKTNYEFGLIEWSSVDPIRRKNIYINDKYDNDKLKFLAGSPDGVAIDNSGEEGLVLLECKCPFRRDLVPGEIPEYYLPQVQLNMAILDIDIADFIEYLPAGIKLGNKVLEKPVFNIVRIYRDDNWFKINVPKLIDLWDEIILWRQKGISNHPLYLKYARQGMSNADTKTVIKRVSKITNSVQEQEQEVNFRDD